MSENIHSERFICPLCGSVEVIKELECKDFFVSGETFPVLSCVSCGFRFTGNVPSDERIGDYYKSSDYISHSDTEKGMVNKIYHLVRSHMLRRKCEMVKSLTGRKSGHILDYGCGTGYFPAKMRQRGWDVSCIEISPDARDFAYRNLGVKAQSPSELVRFDKKSFDCITLWHVMEHVSDMHEKMDFFRDLLKDDGVLIMAVPNCLSYDAQKYGYRWAAYDVPRHLWHFVPETMKMLGADHRFKLEKMLPMPFDAFYISMMSEKNSQSSFPFLRGMYTGIVAWFKSIGRVERSSSVVYVFKKKD